MQLFLRSILTFVSHMLQFYPRLQKKSLKSKIKKSAQFGVKRSISRVPAVVSRQAYAIASYKRLDIWSFHPEKTSFWDKKSELWNVNLENQSSKFTCLKFISDKWPSLYFTILTFFSLNCKILQFYESQLWNTKILTPIYSQNCNMNEQFWTGKCKLCNDLSFMWTNQVSLKCRTITE